MVIKTSPATNEALIIPAGSMASDKVASILNEDGLTSLLDGSDAQATRCFFEDYLCDDLDVSCYFANV